MGVVREREDTILIVEDDPPQARLLENVLRREGYTQLVVEHDPVAALNLFKSQPFDLMLLDYEMPEMNGFKLMEQMLQHQQAQAAPGEVLHYLPIIMVTGDSQQDVRLHALANGAKDFITKPYVQEEVVSRVANLLEIQRVERQLKRQTKVLADKFIEVSEKNREILRQKETIEAINHQLRDERDFVSSIIGSVQEGIVVVDYQGRIERANQMFLEMLGEGGPLEGRRVSEWFPQTEKQHLFTPALQQTFYQSLQQQWQQDREQFWKVLEESQIPVLIFSGSGEVTFSNDAAAAAIGVDGKPMAGLGMGELLSNELDREQLSQLLRQSIDGEERAGPLTIHFSSQRVSLQMDVTGFAMELEGERQVLMLCWPLDGLDWELFKLTPLGQWMVEPGARGGNGFTVERTLGSQGKSSFPVQLSGSWLYQQTGGRSSCRAVMMFYDLRGRKALEQMAQEAAYRGGIAETGSQIVHSFGNKLTTVRFFLDGLVSFQNLSAQFEEMLRNNGEFNGRTFTFEELADAVASANRRYLGDTLGAAQEVVNRMSRVILEQQSDIGKGAQFWVSRFALSEALEEPLGLIREWAEQADVALEIAIDPLIDTVELPKRPLQQLVFDLLKNSIEAIEVRRLEYGLAPQGRVQLEIAPSGEVGQFRVCCSDNGMKLGSSEARRNMFLEDHAASDQLRGEGLHASANFVSAVGGTIVVGEGGEREGCAIQVMLPLSSSLSATE